MQEAKRCRWVDDQRSKEGKALKVGKQLERLIHTRPFGHIRRIKDCLM